MSNSADETTLVEETLNELAAEEKVSMQTGEDDQIRYSSAGAEGRDIDST